MPSADPHGEKCLGPVTQVVLKVHGRCDLACDHCYVYEGADRSWSARPPVMAPQTAQLVAGRLRDHALRHGLEQVAVVLHGGEPLLLGPDRLAEILLALRQGIEPATRLALHLQTNGVRLTEAIAEVLADFEVRVGVSLDGDQPSNDLHRRFADGRSSYPQVMAALALLRSPPYRAIYGGILATVDVRNDPIAVYESLLRQEPPRIDLLLPHATWEHPPLRSVDGRPVYAEWLGRVFERWMRDGRPVPIRIFDSLLSLHGGGPSGSESLGLGAFDLAVVETDGSWELPDSLKVTRAGAPRTGLDVANHSIDDVLELLRSLPPERALHRICDTCRACPVVAQCGGGLPAHRFDPARGLANPSVYCPDLQVLVPAVGRRVEPPPAGPPESQRDASAGPAGAAVEARYRLNRRLAAAIGGGLDGGVGRDGWELLTQLEHWSPDAVRIVLGHPYVRVWARRRLVAQAAGDDAAHVDHLGALAAAAAVRAGFPAELTLAATGGALHLPTLGTVFVPDSAEGLVPVRITAEGFEVRIGSGGVRVPAEHAVPERRASDAGAGQVAAPSAGVAWWRPLTCLGAGPSALLVDDADPYRDCFATPVSRRLEGPAMRAWGTALEEAWERAGGPGQAGASLTTVTPLRPRRDGRVRTARDRDAGGALALGVTHRVEQLAGLLSAELERGRGTRDDCGRVTGQRVEQGALP